MRYFSYYYYDATYVLVVIGMLICLWASFRVNSAMKKYRKIAASSNMTGAEAARRILNNAGLYNVQVECLDDNSGDHYDPRTKTVNLSRSNFNSASVTAVSVAAHECGHAIQDEEGYVPLNVRTMIIPAVNIGSQLGIPLIILGVILSWNTILIQIGIWAFSLSVIFQLVTLPVEFNASRRAVALIENNGLLSASEEKGCKAVLRAAAMTYVAAAAASVLQLLRLIILYGGNNRRRD